MTQLRAAAEERAARLAAVRLRERRSRNAGKGNAFGGIRKRPRLSGSELEDQAAKGDDQYLPEDGHEDGDVDDGIHLSPEVRALMAKLSSKPVTEEEADEDVPKVGSL